MFVDVYCRISCHRVDHAPTLQHAYVFIVLGVKGLIQCNVELPSRASYISRFTPLSLNYSQSYLLCPMHVTDQLLAQLHPL